MQAVYFRVPTNPGRAKQQGERFLTAIENDHSGRDWSLIRDLVSRGAAHVDSQIAERLADLCVYVEPDDGGLRRSCSRPSVQRLKQDATEKRFTRLFVTTIPSLGRDIRDVVATVHELVSHGVTIFPMAADAEPVGPEVVGPLKEVFNWHREIDRNKRSTAIRKGQTKVRAGGKRIGRPKRVFDRQQVVRLRDVERRSWSQIAEALGIGIRTARRAYAALAAASGPAKTIREVA